MLQEKHERKNSFPKGNALLVKGKLMQIYTCLFFAYKHELKRYFNVKSIHRVCFNVANIDVLIFYVDIYLNANKYTNTLNLIQELNNTLHTN